MVRLDRASSEPMWQQLYRQIRAQLESGNFERRFRLPSSRTLASDLGVSRMTVKLAFARLQAEGYLRTAKGSGTYVADRLPKEFLIAPKPTLPPARERTPRFADRVETLLDPRTPEQLNYGAGGPPGLTFLSGFPAVDEFPIATWERLRAEVLEQKGSHLLRYASSRGELDLRKALAAYLCDFRGARCHPEQILVVAGLQQALLLCALALVNPGEAAWTEDPGYHQARRVFAFAGARVVPRPLDREGMVLAGSKARDLPKLIYVTPSHQFPLGVTMSLKRREALLQFGREHDAYILEDDYDSEFRFDGPPLPCLQGLDEVGRVIYAGSMSKILYPSARLGYVIAPERMISSLVKIRSVMDQHSPPIDQATLARFIAEGYFLSHVQRMRTIYRERREYFLEQFQRRLGQHFTLEEDSAGLHIVAWLRRAEDLARFNRARESTGMIPTMLSVFCIKAKLPPAFVFGFAPWSRAQIKEGLTKLAKAFDQERAKSRSARAQKS